MHYARARGGESMCRDLQHGQGATQIRLAQDANPNGPGQRKVEASAMSPLQGGVARDGCSYIEGDAPACASPMCVWVL